jgi:hypothetical protein
MEGWGLSRLGTCLYALTIGNRLLWGAAEPLYRIHRIRLENRFNRPCFFRRL